MFKFLLLSLILLNSCKQNINFVNTEDNSPQLGYNAVLDRVIKGLAVITITNAQGITFFDLLKSLIIPKAYAATSSTNITYINAASTVFSINTINFSAGSLNNDYLDLGSLVLSNIEDNKLKECGPGNNQKCSAAYIRTYTTGSVSGFVHDEDGYGMPVYSGHNTLDPQDIVGLTSINGVDLQTLTIPTNKNKIKLSDFTNPTYNYISDFNNAGSGSYSMTVVLEYSLSL